MKERNLLNFAENIKHIYISLGYKQSCSSTKYKYQKSVALRHALILQPAAYRIFSMGIAVSPAFFVYY